METVVLPGWVVEILVYTILVALGVKTVRGRINSGTDVLEVEVRGLIEDIKTVQGDIRALSNELHETKTTMALLGQRLDRVEED